MAVFNENRTFGVEIEMITANDGGQVVADLNRSLRYAGLAETAYDQTAWNQYSHSVPTGWKVMSDSSVSRGWEIVSPILKGTDGLNQLKAVCKALESSEYKVDKSCGLHIHHGITDLNGDAVGKAFGLYHSYQPVLDYLVSPSRRGHRVFTSPMPTRSFANPKEFEKMTKRQATNKIRNGMGCSHRQGAYGPSGCRCGARYHTMNPLSILTQDTIEFRQHHGTIEYAKISNWILLTQSIIEAAREMKVFPKPVASLKANKKTQGNFYRLKSATRYNPKSNLNNAPEDCRPYQDMWKFYNKVIIKFANRDGIALNQIGR